MPRTPGQQRQTRKAFIAEIRRSPNALQLATLFQRVYNDYLENLLEGQELAMQAIERQSRTIAELKATVELLKQGTADPHPRRWN